MLDSPPVLHVADPVLLAKLCQHVIFIVEAGRVHLANRLARLLGGSPRRIVAKWSHC